MLNIFILNKPYLLLLALSLYIYLQTNYFLGHEDTDYFLSMSADIG